MYRSDFIDCYIEKRIDDDGGPALFRRDSSMPAGLFEVHLIGYAVIPMEKFSRLREPLWFRFKRWLTGEERSNG